MTRTYLAIDSDGGIDDAVGLWWAATRPDVELLALTSVWGNVDERIAAANLCRVLHLTGRAHVPVAVGAAEAFGPAPYPARTTCVVQALPDPKMLIEIEGVASFA